MQHLTPENVEYHVGALLDDVAVGPIDSPVLSQRADRELQPGPHKIQGLGAGFVPDMLELGLVDEIFTVSNDQSMEMGRRLCREDGLMVGISSGGVAHAAFEIGKRYLSAALYEFPGEEDPRI